MPHTNSNMLSPMPSNQLWDREFDTILIDLDDTLYCKADSGPAAEEIPALVRRNIEDYMVQHLGIPRAAVPELTQQLYYEHGTTMAGLAASGHQLDFDHYHAHVHGSLDYQRLLSAQPVTRQTLADLALQKHILTNADAKHAATCLELMGLTDCFQSIWCFENIMDTARSKGLLTQQQPILCKPNKQAFQLVLEQLGASPESTIFIDDSVRNITAAHELGIFTVLVSPKLAAAHAAHQQVAGADLVVAGFNQLREVLPQVFVAAEPSMSEVVPAAVPVSVMAS